MRTKSAVRPIFAAHLESHPLVTDAQRYRSRRLRTVSRERRQAADAGLNAADDQSLVPLGLAALQTTATLSACAASWALRPGQASLGHNAYQLAWGAGFVATAAAMQSMQLGLTLWRRADSIVAVSALSLSSLAVGCAGAVILGGAHGAQAARDREFAACLLGLAWLSHIAAMGAQVHRDEIAWGTTPRLGFWAQSPCTFAAMATTSAAMAFGGVASIAVPTSSPLPHPIAQGAALVALSVVAATLALSGAIRETV